MRDNLFVLVLGVSHTVDLNPDRNRYLELLKSVCTSYDVKHISEEFSIMALSRYNLEQTSAQEVASKLNIGHLLMDPDIDERKTLGIRLREDIAYDLGIHKDDEAKYTEAERTLINEASKPFDRAREEEWLKRATPYIANGTMLFICGYEHCDSVITLLQNRGYTAKCVGAFKD